MITIIILILSLVLLLFKVRKNPTPFTTIEHLCGSVLWKNFYSDNCCVVDVVVAVDVVVMDVVVDVIVVVDVVDVVVVVVVVDVV